MKKLIFTIGLLISQNSWALRISIPGVVEIKADDPQIIKDATRGVQKLGAETANGIRDISSALGNATGISGVLEHNSETIQNTGRAGACVVTLCYSEYNRKKELEQQESEQKQQLEAELSKYRNELAVSSESEKQKSLERTKALNLSLLKAYGAQLSILDQDFEATTTLANIVHAEKVYRERLQQIGTVPEQTSPDTQGASTHFEQNINAGFQTALMQVEPELQRVVLATGRSQARIRAELFRLVNGAVIDKLETETQAHLIAISKEKADLELSIQQCRSSAASNSSSVEAGS